MAPRGRLKETTTTEATAIVDTAGSEEKRFKHHEQPSFEQGHGSDPYGTRTSNQLEYSPRQWRWHKNETEKPLHIKSNDAFIFTAR